MNSINSTPENAMYATPIDYVFTMKPKLQETNQLMREIMDVQQESQKTYYNHKLNGTNYKKEELLVFNPTVKRRNKTKKTSFYIEPYTIVES